MIINKLPKKWCLSRRTKIQTILLSVVPLCLAKYQIEISILWTKALSDYFSGGDNDPLFAQVKLRSFLL